MATYFFFNSNAEAGFAAQNPSAEIAQPWRGYGSGWTHVAAPRLGAWVALIFFYNRNTGATLTVGLSATGQEIYRIPGQLDRGWTHITGTNGGLLLLYHAPSGRVQAIRVEPSGTPRVGLIRYLEPRMNWSWIMDDGNRNIIFYDPAGYVASGVIDSLLEYRQTIGPMRAFPGHTHVAASGSSLLFYDTVSGKAETGVVLYGRIGMTGYYPSFGKGLSHFVSRTDGTLVYGAASGVHCFGSLGSNGWRTIGCSQAGADIPGLTHVVDITLGSSWGLNY
jgi:hypothetical protein